MRLVLELHALVSEIGALVLDKLRESCVTSRESSIHFGHLALTPRNQRVHSGKPRADAGDQPSSLEHLSVDIRGSTLDLGDERATLRDLCLTPGDESLSVGNQSVNPGAPLEKTLIELA